MTKSKVNWKIGTYGEAGALSETEIEKLAADFNLPRQQLAELSVALARCLHPDYPPPAVAEPIAQLIRGPKELEKGIAKLKRAERSLSEALQHFSQVKMVDPHGRTGFENPFVVFRQDLRAARRKMRSVQQIYSKNIKRRTTIFDGVPDRRRVRDERRLAVCHSIFRFWEGTGQKLSFTTNTNTNDREGPLVVFVNAVVPCLTDPAEIISGHTIFDDYKAYRDR